MGFFNSIIFIILSITLYQSILHLPVAAKDVLMPGDELNSLDSTSILLSTGGIFTLGFFTILSSTNLTYLGIWYTDEKQSMKVWVANRDIPIIGDGILTIDDSGSLKVISKSGATLFNVSNDKVGSSSNTRAMLQDSGNFLVYDVAANRTIWQSFDHPTDTLLAGMKIGYNLTTRQNWTLTSWADVDAPASGAFTMSLVQYQNSTQLLIYRRGGIYWASGPWNKTTRYLIVQTMGSHASTLQLSPTGQFVDSQLTLLSTPDFCYGYHSDGSELGCVVSALPYCRVLPSVIDFTVWGMSNFISGRSKYDDNSSISLGDCMERCWNDCNCKACSTNNNGTGCIYWSQNSGIGDDEESRQVYVLQSIIISKRFRCLEDPEGDGLCLKACSGHESRLRDEKVQVLVKLGIERTFRGAERTFMLTRGQDKEGNVERTFTPLNVSSTFQKILKKREAKG